MTLGELLEQTENITARKLIQDEIDIFGADDRAQPGLITQVLGFTNVPNKTPEEYAASENHRHHFNEERKKLGHEE